MAFAENKVETYLCGRISKLGGECHKWAGTRHCPDRIVILPCGTVWFVEVKTVDGGLSHGQSRFINRLSKLNANAVTVYGITGVINWINAHLIKS